MKIEEARSRSTDINETYKVLLSDVEEGDVDFTPEHLSSEY